MVAAYEPALPQDRDEKPTSYLFLHSSDDVYGSDRVLLSLVDIARNADGRVRVLLPDDMPKGWLSDQLHQLGAEIYRVPLAVARRRYLVPSQLPGYVRHLLRARRAVREHVAEVAPDIVHVNSCAIPVAATIGRSGGRRVIWHVHELVVSPRHIAWLLRNLPMWAATDVIANSDVVAANLRRARIKRARVRRVYNGIELRPDRRDSRPTAPTKCVFVGRINRWKGYEVFVEAAGLVNKSIGGVQFVVAGSPPVGEEWRTDDLLRRVEDHGIAGSTEVLGYCDDVPALLDRSHVAAVPSLWPEPFGLVIIEAMRSGCAVVATNHGAPTEIIADGEDGLLVPPGDPPALAAAVGRLLTDHDLRRRLTANASRKVEASFSQAQFREEIAEVWRNGA